jgi:hypothetical protein
MLIEAAIALAAVTAAPAAEPEDTGEELPLTRILETTIPLDGNDGINMHLDTADIRLIAADRDDIGITLELESQKIIIFSNRRTTWAIHRASIISTMEDGVLALGIDFPVRVDDSWLSSTWLIEVPRELAADITVESGSIDAHGLEGGLRINLVSGSIDVDVPNGPLDLRSTNGSIEARVAASDYSSLTLKLVNGSADLIIDGEEQELGFSEGVERQGSGEHSFHLETVNGGIELALGTGSDQR